MASRRTDAIGHALAINIHDHTAARLIASAVDQTHLRRIILAKGYDSPDPMRLGGSFQALELCIVAVEDAGAVRLQPIKDLGLGVGDGMHALKPRQMRRLDGRDQRDMGAHQL